MVNSLFQRKRAELNNFNLRKPKTRKSREWSPLNVIAFVGYVFSRLWLILVCFAKHMKFEKVTLLIILFYYETVSQNTKIFFYFLFHNFWGGLISHHNSTKKSVLDNTYYFYLKN